MTATDISATLVAKSDQLNADDLVTGPITVTITGVSVNPNPNAEQPVAVSISGGHKPWKPSKTMRRVLAHAWGSEGSNYIGRSITLFRNPDVKWSGKAVGGIEIAAMSHITQRIKLTLAESKGKKTDHLIEILKVMSEADFRAACAAATRKGWTREQIATVIGGKVADVAPGNRRDFADVLAGDPPSLVGTNADEQTQQAATAADLTDEDKARIEAAENAENKQ